MSIMHEYTKSRRTRIQTLEGLVAGYTEELERTERIKQSRLKEGLETSFQDHRIGILQKSKEYRMRTIKRLKRLIAMAR